jgi:hypothetical protein
MKKWKVLPKYANALKFLWKKSPVNEVLMVVTKFSCSGHCAKMLKDNIILDLHSYNHTTAVDELHVKVAVQYNVRWATCDEHVVGSYATYGEIGA